MTKGPAIYSGNAFALLSTDSEAMAALSLAGDELGGSGWSLFLNARFDNDEREVSVNEDGFDRDGQSLTLGLDRRISPNLGFGLAVGFGRGDLEFTGASGTLDTDELGVNLYANWQSDGGFYVDSLVAFNQRENDQVRRVAYGVGTATVDQRYDADFDSSDRLLALTAGYRFNRGGWSFDPYARIEWIDAESDGYSEISRTPDNNGAGWALDVAGQNENFTREAIGFRGAYAISGQNGVYQPFFDLTWVHSSGVDDEAGRVRFRGDASTGVNLSPVDFFMIADGEDHSFGVLSLGVSAQWQNGWSGFVGYRQNFAEDRYEHRELNGGVRMEF
jgi:outer membrane lipase/esterase